MADDIVRHITKSEDFTERRKTARLDVAIKVHYLVKRQTADGFEAIKNAVTKDISLGGCLLLVAEDIQIGSELELEILLGETDSEALRIKGRILRLNRQEHGLYEYGIAFDSISKETRRLFADYFFAKMYEMIGLSEWPTDRKTKQA